MKAAKLLFLLLFVTVSANSYNEIPDRISNEVANLKTGKITHHLTKLVSQISKIKDKKIANDVFCQTCDLVFSQIIYYRSLGTNKQSMIDFFSKLCRVFTTWGDVACDGYINIEIDTVLFILDNRKDLTPARICGIYFQKNNCIDPNENKWVIPLPKKTHRKHHNYAEADPVKILHLTDFHFDPLYTPGSKAVCDLPLCCQKNNGPAINKSEAAGFWGDYHVCDTPWHTVTNFTAYLTTLNEKYNFVYYTGDIISHRSWATDKNDNIKAVKQLFQHFNETFKTTSVYAILGNHEPHPTDFWSSDNITDIKPAISTQWMFDLVGYEWTTRWAWLPTAANVTIKKGGYYTLLVPNQSKLRIIALNSNVCFISNLWLIYDDEDPYDQLKWLAETLAEAEKNNEIVHILSHIPPGHELCLQRWSNQFRRIVERFAPIIAAQFNGHTHLDELRLFRDVNNSKKVISAAFNGGSFTSFVGFNPNYRTYTIDANNYRVLDYEHFTFNLTKANLKNDTAPEWYKLYSFKEAYGLKNVTNEGYGDLIERMSKNKTLVKQYGRFQVRESDVYIHQKCDDLCLDKLLCTITAVETVEALKCQDMKKKKHH